MGVAVDFYIKQEDTAPPLTATLVDENEAAVPLTNASGVVFHMIDPGNGTPKIEDGAVSIIDAPGGRVSYLWQAGDTDDPGDYDGEFEVTWDDGTKTSFPNFRYMRIKITKDINVGD